MGRQLSAKKVPMQITDEMAEVLAQWFKALGDPTRIRLLAFLKENGEQSVGSLSAALDLSQTSTSRHLAVLRRMRTVSTRRDGTTIFYALRGEVIPTVCSAICEDVLAQHDRLRSHTRPSRSAPKRRPARSKK